MNTCPLQAYFTLFIDYQHITLIKDFQMNVWQRKIDDQRSVFQRVLPPKNALQYLYVKRSSEATEYLSFELDSERMRIG